MVSLPSRHAGMVMANAPKPDVTSTEAEADLQHLPDDDFLSGAAHEDTEGAQEDAEPETQGAQPGGTGDQGEAQQSEDTVDEPNRFNNEDEDEAADVHDGSEEAKAANEAFTPHTVEEHAIKGDELGDADADGVGDDEEHFDADDIHGQADEGEGDDYYEREQFPEDEDGFGEDLPEELGGQVADTTYTHPGVEDGSEDVASNTQAVNANVSSDDMPEKPGVPSPASGVDHTGVLP